MERSVIPFCENWSIVSAIYIYQSISKYHPLNPNTTTGYKLKEWLDEASQCQIPSLNLCKFDYSELSWSLQVWLDQFYSLLKNPEVTNQRNNIKYLTISNKKVMEDDQIQKKDTAFFVNQSDYKNIQVNININKVNWKLVAVFSGKQKLCFCIIQNEWRNLSCSCANINWNELNLVLCYVKLIGRNTEKVDIDILQKIDHLFCHKNINENFFSSKNKDCSTKGSKIIDNKKLIYEEQKSEILPAQKNEIKRTKKNKKSVAIEIISKIEFSVLNKHIEEIYFASEDINKADQSNKAEIENIAESKSLEFSYLSCQYPQECLISSQKSSDSGCIEHQKQIDSLRKSNEDKQRKIDGLDLDVKSANGKIEKMKNSQEELQKEMIILREAINAKEKDNKKICQALESELVKNKISEIENDRLQKLNDEKNKVIEEIKKKSDIKASKNSNIHESIRTSCWFEKINLPSLSKELEKYFSMIETLQIKANASLGNFEEKITKLQDKHMKNKFENSSNMIKGRNLNNGNQIKNKQPIIEEVKESSTVNLSPIFENAKLGLPNIGNSCYMNSLLQILASTNCFVEAIQNTSDSPMLKKLSSLLSKVRNRSTKMPALAFSLEEFILEISKEYPHVIFYTDNFTCPEWFKRNFSNNCFLFRRCDPK